MENKATSSAIRGIMASCWISSVIIFYACNNNKPITSSFYYAGNTKVEITIVSDTLGILLKDTVLTPQDTSMPYFDKVLRFADSSLPQQGFANVGNLENDPHVRLVLNPAKKYTKSAFFNQVENLTGPQNKVFVQNAGYLVRIKETNKPLILTNEIIIQFKPGTTRAAIISLFNSNHLSELRRNRYDSLQYTVAVTRNSPYEVLRMSHVLKDNTSISFAEINFIYVKKTLSADPYFDLQWHLASERSTATDDADIDADLAWNLTMGTEDIVIAVIDLGFDTLHLDLEANIVKNTLEVPANASDDDGNGYTDDYLGWNFDGGGDNNLFGDMHGTAVLGVANATGDNKLGVAGSCPKCKSLLIKTGHVPERDADALDYAILRKARIINISWDYGSQLHSAIIASANRAINAGIVVVFAMSNANGFDYCDRTRLDLIPGAIAVSRSNSKDSYDEGGMGHCISLLAPSGAKGARPGYLKLLTTDMTDWRGYNTGATDQFCNDVFRDDDYTICFWGTSASAPLTAGVAGLILSADRNLTPEQVKYLMQDCADRVDHTAAQYSPKDGKSTKETHGYGRLNAYEAVKIASAELDKGGRNGVDIFLRDHELDWGNTEKPSSYSFEPTRGTLHWWKSQDIKIDAPDASGNFTSPADSKGFEDFPDESPVANTTNRVYVRVHNRGFNPATTVQVKLYWVYGGLALPPLWTNFPQDIVGDPVWHFLGNVTLNNLGYSGASVAYYGDDKSQIATFEFVAPTPDPSQRNHYCLAALIDSPDDPLFASGVASLDDATKGFNNISHRNYSIKISSEDALAADALTIYNPYPFPAPTKISIVNPKNIKIKINNLLVDTVFTLKPKEQKRFTIKIDSIGTNSPGEITLVQEFISPVKKKKEILGGFTIYYGKQKMSPKK